MYKPGLGLSGLCSEDCLAKYLTLRKKRNRVAQRNGNGTGKGLKALVRKRDNYACRLCFATENLHVHHIRYRSEGGPDHEENLILLCLSCHELVHSNKRLYQPALQLWLWLKYRKGEPVKLEKALRMLESHSAWVDEARLYADSI